MDDKTAKIIDNIVTLYADGYSLTSISKQLNITTAITKQCLTTAGILVGKEDLSNKVLLYWLSGYKTSDIAHYLRITSKQVTMITSDINLLSSDSNTLTLADRSNRKIRQLYKKGYTSQDISDQIGLDVNIVLHIINNSATKQVNHNKGG